MKKYLISIILVAVFVSSALAKPEKGEKQVTLTEVSETLKQFEGNEEYDFVKSSIVYKEIESDNYDKIFKESAVIYATITQVKGTLGLINEEKVELKSEFAILSIAFAAKDLPNLKEKITDLQDAIAELNPKNDFKGRNMAKAPKATAGIQIANEHLSNSLKELPELLEQLKSITEKE